MPAAQTVRVWDPLVRIVHWSVASLIVIDLVNEAGANPWHRYFGYAAGALVLVRLAWGFISTRHASLTLMVRTARRAVQYVSSRGLGSGRAVYVAHNPLGACMALLMWGLILVVVATGWMHELDAFWGDENVQLVHSTAAYVLGGCAVVHVTAAIVTSPYSRTNLTKAMITGRKNVTET